MGNYWLPASTYCKNCDELDQNVEVGIVATMLDSCPNCGAEHLGREKDVGALMDKHSVNTLQSVERQYGPTVALDWLHVVKFGVDTEKRAEERSVSTRTVEINVEKVKG